MTYKDFENCGLHVALRALSGKWKPAVLYLLFAEDGLRFTALWRAIPKVAKKVLFEQLRQMEADGLILREVAGGFPPEVSYRLSPGGRALGPALAALDAWALAHPPPDKQERTISDGDTAAPTAGRNPVTAAEML